MHLDLDTHKGNSNGSVEGLCVVCIELNIVDLSPTLGTSCGLNGVVA